VGGGGAESVMAVTVPPEDDGPSLAWILLIGVGVLGASVGVVRSLR